MNFYRVEDDEFKSDICDCKLEQYSNDVRLTLCETHKNAFTDGSAVQIELLDTEPHSDKNPFWWEALG